MASTEKRLPVNTAKRNIHQTQSRRCLFFGSVFILAFALYLLFSPVFLWAAPFSKYFQFASKNLVSTDAIAPQDVVITKDDALPDLQAPQGQAMAASVTEGDPFWV